MMNERIRELAKQNDLDITIDGMGYGEGDIEGLIKLIVKECAECAAVDSESIGNRIKDEFGVE